jgi:hypothetical protein
MAGAFRFRGFDRRRAKTSSSPFSSSSQAKMQTFRTPGSFSLVHTTSPGAGRVEIFARQLDAQNPILDVDKAPGRRPSARL